MIRRSMWVDLYKKSIDFLRKRLTGKNSLAKFEFVNDLSSGILLQMRQDF